MAELGPMERPQDRVKEDGVKPCVWCQMVE